ncbi:MAG TPA: hypothetical protein VLH15_01040 [Dehalococcoidales bacterium]|nr:hypothetical protein [Dehalococcoidales bacterium]
MTVKKMVKADELDAFLDQMRIPRGKARIAAKTYCQAKIASSEGQCLPSDDLSFMAKGYYDGYSESLRGG